MKTLLIGGNSHGNVFETNDNHHRSIIRMLTNAGEQEYMVSKYKLGAKLYSVAAYVCSKEQFREMPMLISDNNIESLN